MVTTCRYVAGDAGSIYPAALDRAAPGETVRIEYDLTADADCAGVGVTINQVSWSAVPDDGLATLSAPSVSGLIISTQMALDPDPTQRVYTITATITLSDARVLLRTCSIPIVPTRAYAAA